jgi:spore maturation protein CgeB
MLEWGYTPSVRLFEAAACGTPVVSDPFPGVDDFFDPDAEILLAHTAEEVESALSRDDAELRRIGNAARERTLVQHTCERRAIELIQLCEASTC